MARRLFIEQAADFCRQLQRIGEIFACHLKIHIHGSPAHRPIGAPLQLDATTRHRRGDVASLMTVGDGGFTGVGGNDGNFQHSSCGGTDGKKRTVARASLRSQNGTHNITHSLMMRQKCTQHFIICAALIERSCRLKLIRKTKLIEKFLQQSIIVSGVALMCAEGVGDGTQWLA